MSATNVVQPQPRGITNPAIKIVEQPGWINVKDHPFSAKGDGVTDDTAAIVAAIAASRAAGGPGGTVYLPSGNYVVSTPIYVPSNTQIQGNGWDRTILKVSATWSGLSVFIPGSIPAGPAYTKQARGNNIRLRDFCIDGSATPLGVQNYCGVMLDNTDFSVAENLHLKGIPAYSVSVGGFGGVNWNDPTSYYMLNPQVRNCLFESPGRGFISDAIGGGGNIGAVYENNIFRDCYGSAIDNVLTIDGLWIGNHSSAPHVIPGGGQFWSDFGAIRLKIIGNTMYGGSIHLFGALGGVAGDTDATPTLSYDCIVAYNTLITAGSGAIIISAANPDAGGGNRSYGHRIIGNSINQCRDNAFALSDCSNVTIADNIVTGWNSDNNANTGLSAAAVSVQKGPTAGQPTSGILIARNTFGVAAFQSTFLVETNGVDVRYEDNLAPSGYYTQIGTTLPQSEFSRNRGIGYLPGQWTQPAVPASGATIINQTPFDQLVSIAGGAVTLVGVNGVNLTAGNLAGPFFVEKGGAIGLAYGAAPTWTWQPVNNS